MALRLINATVSISVDDIESLICVAASTRPPKVSISKIMSEALFVSAKSIALETVSYTHLTLPTTDRV